MASIGENGRVFTLVVINGNLYTHQTDLRSGKDIQLNMPDQRGGILTQVEVLDSCFGSG
jgi:hypothetical protein